jgi:hypothetical protein
MLATYWSTGTCGLDRPIGDACTRARPRRRRRLSLHMEELTHSLLAGGSSPPPTLARTIIAGEREIARDSKSHLSHRRAGRRGVRVPPRALVRAPRARRVGRRHLASTRVSYMHGARVLTSTYLRPSYTCPNGRAGLTRPGHD